MADHPVADYHESNGQSGEIHCEWRITMLDMMKLMPAAKAAFEKELREKVNWLASKCWEMNLEHNVREINTLLEAAGRMGVLNEVTLLDEKEIIELSNDLRPLRTLKMTGEAYDHIIRLLVDHRVPATVFASRASEVQCLPSQD